MFAGLSFKFKTIDGFGFLDSFTIKTDELVYTSDSWKDLKRVLKLIGPCMVWVEDLSIFFQFIKKHFGWDDVFATDRRSIIKAKTVDGYEFRCMTTVKGIGSNDVEELYEWGKFCEDNFGENIPLTKTGIVRADVAKSFAAMPDEDREAYMRFIHHCFPKKEEYKEWMDWLFQGGYCHADSFKIGEVIEGVMRSFDFKSSYISVMFEPMPTKFYEIEPSTCLFQNCINSGKAVIAFIVLENPKAVTTHCTMSDRKIKSAGATVISENGRVQRAYGKVGLWVNEFDFKVLEKFYVWDSIEVVSLYSADKQMLPKFILDVVYNYFCRKDALAKGDKLRDLVKTLLNALYGMCVTGLFQENLKFDGTKMVASGRKIPYWVRVKDQLLLPQWGWWIASMSRYNLLMTVYDITMNTEGIGSDAMYMDTDSIKLLNVDKHIEFIERYNNKIMLRNAKIQAEYGYDLKRLGTWDDEGRILRFKTLGCKRYLSEKEDGKIEFTISGIEGEKVLEYCKAMGYDPFTFFDDNMAVPDRYSGRYTFYYCDSAYGTELSGVGKVPTAFHMGLDEGFLSYLRSRKDIERYSERKL